MKKTLKSLALAVLIGLTGCASLQKDSTPEMVATDGQGNYVWINEKPCTNDKVLVYISVSAYEHMRDGRALLGGEEMKVCWAAMPGAPVIGVVLEDGSDFYVPIDKFEAAQGSKK